MTRTPSGPGQRGSGRRGSGRRGSGRRGSGQRGSATLLATAVLGLLFLVGAALGVTGAMVHAHRVAQSAADLAALSGARASSLGHDACVAAAEVAAANGGRLERCEVEASSVRVLVTVTGPRWLGQPHDLSAEARAGAVDPEAGDVAR